jgi:LmbE family N-acetylglucosaminyl deacetylase
MTTYFAGPFSNSLFTTPEWQKREVMIFVPHADDEINLTGATLANLCAHKIKTRLVYFTNSDDTGESTIRMQEALSAAKVLGLAEEDVIFLGYCNNYRVDKDKHFYNKPDDFVQTSSTGRTETTCLPEHPEFCYAETGKHHTYTKANLRADVKAVLLKYQPDVVFCVDFDRHQDHRALSLIFEEAVAEILRTPKNTYTPEIYKGFAYNGSYLGRRDFYRDLNLAGELQAEGDFSNDLRFDTDWPPYIWQERLRLPVPASCLSRTMRSSKIYKALQQHFSQGIIHNAKRVINSDQIFWRRLTDSVAYQAEVSVSSGDGKLLTDFKLADCADVYAKPTGFTGTWIPAKDDSQKTARLTFTEPVTIARVILHGNVEPESKVEAVELRLSSGFTAQLGPLPSGAQSYVYVLPKAETVSWLEVKLTKTSGPAAGLNEIEVYKATSSPSAFKFVKVMVKDTFAYDWWLRPQEKKVALSLYTYGCETEGAKIYPPDTAPQKFLWEMSSTGSCSLHGSTLELADNFEEATIKVSLADAPEVYDQVVIRRPGSVQLAHLKVVQGMDQIAHRVEHIAKSTYVKYK